MFNAIVEEEEENADVEVDEGKSKELKEKLAQSIEEFSSELKETLTQSLGAISSEAEPTKEKKSIWSVALFGVKFSIGLIMSFFFSLFVYFNAILGCFPGGLLGESSIGDKFYYYVYFEKILGTYPDGPSFIRPTWEFAGTLSMQDLLLLGLSFALLILTFVKLQLRGFKLFSTGEAKENTEEGTEELFLSSKVLVFVIVFLYVLTLVGALSIDNRFEDTQTLILPDGDNYVVHIDQYSTFRWEAKLLDKTENGTYSILFLSEFNCDRYESGSLSSSESIITSENLDSSSSINPKRVSRDNYCIAIESNGGLNSSVTIKYLVEAS